MVAVTNQETVALAPIIVEQTVDRTAIASLSVIQVLDPNGPRKTNVLSMFVALSTDTVVVINACQGEDFGDGVPQRYGGYIWAGWNETCIKDPKTKKYCNDIIDVFTLTKDEELTPLRQLCHPCHRHHLAMIQSSSYSVYNGYDKSQLEKFYKQCNVTGPTELPPPPRTEEPAEYCLSTKFYEIKEGDTCDSIARAHTGVAGVMLYRTNRELIDHCNNLPIDRECTNLHKDTDFYGKSICIGAYTLSSGPLDAKRRKESENYRPSRKYYSANGPAPPSMKEQEERYLAANPLTDDRQEELLSAKSPSDDQQQQLLSDSKV
ncbi:hypothetical protein BFJ69_g15014 [Fusarium oxysporum]|uniref:LysM domain-containing protein n=1 Tax=Fusarium oxysporum TaxID=5507 RepID=A0A420MFQ9_FUSOX|nr:hypothetical protein BFJ69_g15014 [Fusarium oxysporum]